MLGFWEEVGEDSLVQLCLSNYTALKQCLSGGIEGPVEESEESDGFLAEKLSPRVVQGTEDVDILYDSLDV
jgi:hypothetical protein